MSTAARLVKLVEGLDADGVLSATKGGTGNTTGGGTSSPTISQIAYSGDDTAANPAGGQTITLTGTNFAQGAKVLINTTQVSVVTVVSATQITFTAPALAAGSYILYVVNTNGSTAIAVPGIQVSGVPAWTTAAGTLGTVYETAAVSATVAATSDSAVTYSLASGTLPTGVTFNSNGTISGTSVLTASSTTYTFTIRATDAENQDTDRSFSLTINPDVVSWSSPANSATLTGAPGVAYSSALVATSAAGKTITYSASALPAGLAISGATITGTPTTAGTSSSTLTATSATTNRTAQVTISWTITVAADTYFPQTTLLLNSETTVAPFTADASTNNFAVTAFGDAKPNNFNPYTPGYYSNYFDGSGDGLTIATGNSALSLGTGDYTVEFWVNPTYIGPSGSSAATMVAVHDGSTDSGWQIFWNDGRLGIRTYYSNVMGWDASSTVMKTYEGKWSHIAYVRSSGTQKIYLDGVEKCSTTGWNWTDTRLTVGYQAQDFNGYISNLRIVKGTALYTATFTPPTQPLTAVANTSVLTCQSNRFVDNSTNAFAITRNGNTKVSAFDPFAPNNNYATYGSTYLNGTTDYLTVPQNAAFNFGTGDFTVEGWWNFNNIATSQGLISLGTGANGGGPYNGWWFDYESSGILRFYRYAGGSEIYSSFSVTLVPGIWYHIACTRSGTAVKMFVNGVQVGTTATSSTSFDNVNSDPLVIGRFITGQGTFYLDGYVSDVRITKGTAVYTANFTPATAPLTAVSGTSLLTCQGNQPINNQSFVDNSTNAFNITRYGNATQGSFSPYGANWSNYFDGNCSINPTTNSGFTWGTGNYTIEMWYNPSVSYAAGNTYLFDQSNNGTRVQIYNNYVRFFFNNGATELAASTAGLGVTVGTWYHLAIVRNSGVITMYINGTSCATANSSADETSTSMKIGNYGGSGYGFTGYISNFRTVKGVAVYTTAFTPPTAPLTAVTGTSLLTCQSPGFTDNSLNNFALTTAATLSTQKFSPFATVTQTPNTYSTYFDGTGDYLTLPSSSLYALGSVFTVELWIYPTNTTNMITLGNFQLGWANSTYWGIATPTVSWDVTSTTMPTQSAWNHIAVVRTGTGTNQTTIYLNGVSVAVGTFTQALTTAVTPYIGSYVDGASALNGYISNLRIVKGTAVYTANFTPATTPLTAVSGTSLLTCQSATLVDNSTNAATITAFGDAKPRQQNPFGFTSATTNGYTVSTIGGSGYFDGTGDTLSIPAGTYLQFTGNYTIEFWIYFTSVAGTQDLIANYVSNAAPDWTILISPSFQYYPSSAASYVNGPTPVANRWYHVAAVRSGTTCSMYIDGVSVGTPLTFSGTLGDATRPAYIGSRGGSSNFTNGYMSDVRITKSAVYTSNFVPPAQPLTAVQNTTLLLNMDKAAIADKSGKVVLECVGDTKISTAVKKYGSASMSFDGSGDRLSTSPGVINSLGSGDFTIEGWVYPLSLSSMRILSQGTSTTGEFLFILNSNGSADFCEATTSKLAFSAGSFVVGEWKHFAIVRSGSGSNNLKGYINGTLAGTGTSSSYNFSATTAIFVGSNPATASQDFQGYIDDLRITRGVARYTTTFTPPSQALITK